VNRVTFQELESAICCPDRKCTGSRPGEKCSAWAYEDNARSVERLFGFKLAGRPLQEGERS
jgi:hypothetical protein